MYERNSEVALGKIVLLPVFAMRNLKETDVDSLAENIKQYGLLNPLLVREVKGKDQYELISGHRRYQALKKLGEKNCLARVIEVDDATAFVIALSENLERTDPNPMEEAHAFERAVKDLKMQEKDIAKSIKRSPAYVSNRIRLLKLIPEVQKLVAEGTIPAGVCEKGFLILELPEDQKELLKQMKQDSQDGSGTSVREVQDYARSIVETRKRRAALAEFLKQDTVKYPKCPKCKKDPDPECHYNDLKKGILGCPTYYSCGHWSAFKGALTQRETNLDGEVSSRGPAPKGGESVVKVESSTHYSNLTVQQIADKLMELIAKGKAVSDVKVAEEWMGMGKDKSLAITITVDSKKTNLPILEAGAKEHKTAPGVTGIELAGGNWGGNNKEVLAQREAFWELEKTIDAKVKPAEIWRIGIDRLVIDHMAISKGKDLVAKMGPMVVKKVYKDYTAWLVAENKTEIFVEEDELRAIVKLTKKVKK